jgi:hypothetical protein
MEASTLILAIGVAVAVIGQAGLILWCRRAGKNHASSVVTERARLVEAAADHQAATELSKTGKLGSKGGVDE